MQKDKVSLTIRLHVLFLVVSVVNRNSIPKIRYKICTDSLCERKDTNELPGPLIFALLALGAVHDLFIFKKFIQGV